MPPQVQRADAGTPVNSQVPVTIEQPKTTEVDKNAAQKPEPPKQDAETAAKNTEAAKQLANDAMNLDNARVQILKNKLAEKLPEKKAPTEDLQKTSTGSPQTLKDQLAKKIAKGTDTPKILPDTVVAQAGPKDNTTINVTAKTDVIASSRDRDEIGEKMAHRITNKSIKPEEIDDVMKKVPTSDSRAVAFAFTKELTNGQLQDFAASEEGENTLKKMQGHLIKGDPEKYDSGMSPDDHHQADRIGTTILHKRLITNAKTNLTKSEDFSKLPEPTRKEMLKAIEINNKDPRFADELKKKSHSVEFLERPEAARNEIVKQMSDKNFPEALKVLAADSNFKNLGENEQAKVIKDLTKFTTTTSYKEMKPDHGAKALEIISMLSIDAEEKNSKSPTARNTVKHLVEGTVPMKFMDKSGTTVAGQAKVFTMEFNIGNPNLLSDTDNLVTMAAHEVNHIVNGKANGQTKPGTVERFLDEYRAYYMEDSAIDMQGHDSIKLQEKISELTSSDPAYAHLHGLYKNNSQFKGIVDEMSKGLNAKPPRITTPEQLRLKLRAMPGGDKSPYLNNAGNMDNH